MYFSNEDLPKIKDFLARVVNDKSLKYYYRYENVQDFDENSDLFRLIFDVAIYPSVDKPVIKMRLTDCSVEGYSAIGCKEYYIDKRLLFRGDLLDELIVSIDNNTIALSDDINSIRAAILDSARSLSNENLTLKLFDKRNFEVRLSLRMSQVLTSGYAYSKSLDDNFINIEFSVSNLKANTSQFKYIEQEIEYLASIDKSVAIREFFNKVELGK